MVSEGGGHLVLSAVFAPDTPAVHDTHDVFAEPLDLECHALARHVLDTGEPFLARTLEREPPPSPRVAPRYFELYRRLGIHSLIIAPLRIHGRSLGQLDRMHAVTQRRQQLAGGPQLGGYSERQLECIGHRTVGPEEVQRAGCAQRPRKAFWLRASSLWKCSMNSG